MADRETPAQEGEVIESGGALTVPRELAGQLAAMFADVPEATSDDAVVGLLERLASATDVQDLDAPWQVAGFGEYVGARLRVNGIRKRASDYGSGLPYYIIADVALIETGESFALTTGAVMVVGQLVRAHALGAFPLDVVVRESGKAKPGQSAPLHLELVR